MATDSLYSPSSSTIRNADVGWNIDVLSGAYSEEQLWGRTHTTVTDSAKRPPCGFEQRGDYNSGTAIRMMPPATTLAATTRLKPSGSLSMSIPIRAAKMTLVSRSAAT